MIAANYRHRNCQPLLLSLITAAVGIAVASAADAFTKLAQQQEQYRLFESVVPSETADEEILVPHLRPSSALSFLCAHSTMPSASAADAGQIAKMCAQLEGIVLMPSAGGRIGGRQRPILIGPEGIGVVDAHRKQHHFWAGPSLNGAGGGNLPQGAEGGGRIAAKRAYDYIRFGRRSATADAAAQLAHQTKKSDKGAGGTYDYIRFG